MDKLYKNLDNDSASVLFVEGEKCVLAVENYTNRSRDKELKNIIVTTTGSKNSIRSANLSILSKFKRLFIFNDNDEGIKEAWTDKIILKIKKHIKEEIDIFTIDQEYLKAFPKGFDIADLIENYGDFSLKNLLSQKFLKVKKKYLPK